MPFHVCYVETEDTDYFNLYDRDAEYIPNDVEILENDEGYNNRQIIPNCVDEFYSATEQEPITDQTINANFEVLYGYLFQISNPVPELRTPESLLRMIFEHRPCRRPPRRPSPPENREEYVPLPRINLPPFIISPPHMPDPPPISVNEVSSLRNGNLNPPPDDNERLQNLPISVPEVSSATSENEVYNKIIFEYLRKTKKRFILNTNKAVGRRTYLF